MTGARHGCPVLCRSCGREIVGCVETKHGYGWVHRFDGRERCSTQDDGAPAGGLRGPHRGRYAMPNVA